jgi:hypothetical protein
MLERIDEYLFLPEITSILSVVQPLQLAVLYKFHLPGLTHNIGNTNHRKFKKIKAICSKDYETTESVEHVTDTACTEKSRRIV